MDRINRAMKTVILKSTLVLQMFLASIVVINAQPRTIRFVLQGETAIVANMQRNASAVFTEINRAAIENRNLVLSENNATKVAIENLRLMWKTSQFHCLVPTYYQTVNKTYQGYSVRNISVFFRAENTSDDKNQDIVIYFDSNGKITDVSIAMEKIQSEKIIALAKSVEETTHRLMLRDFLEQFRTAYCRKDINTIDKMFSEYALIITGYKVDTLNRETRIPKSSTVYTEKNKKQYMNDLRRVFASNKSLDIKFPPEKICFMQHPNNEKVYAIRCWQDWSSIRLSGIDGYKDSGWLTLIIDFTNEDEPKIWVRAWQDPKFREDELIKVGNFNF